MSSVEVAEPADRERNREQRKTAYAPPSARSVPRRILSVTILVAFAAWAAWYVHDHRGDFAGIRRVSWLDLVSLYGASLVLLGFNGLLLRDATRIFGVRLRAPEWASLSAFSSFANYFLPFRGGAGLRAVYLAKVHRLHLADFLTTLSALVLMHAVANGALALVGMIALWMGGGTFDPLLGLFFASVVGGGLALIAVPPRQVRGGTGFPLAQIARLIAGWQRLRRHPRSLWRLWLFTGGFSLASLWQCAQAFSAIGAPLSPAGNLVYAGAKNLAFLAGLTPGSLGIVEAVSVYLGGSLSYSPAQALLVQGLIRAVSLSVLLVTGLPALHLLRKRLAAPNGVVRRERAGGAGG